MKRITTKMYLLLVLIGSTACCHNGFLQAVEDGRRDESKSAPAEWTFLVYAQANNDLNSFAVKNFRDMAKVGSNNRVNVLVEWVQPRKKGGWRYRIDKGKMSFQEHVSDSNKGNYVSDVVNSMKWAVSKFPAKHYALVLWNHGSGVFDPLNWGRFIRKPALSEFNYRDGLAPQLQKGILFDWTTKTYMDNQQLARAMKKINRDVLGGRKIDIIGMDACLMAMAEIGYQIKDTAEWFVGSQEVEYAEGWSYSPILSELTVKPLSPLSLAQLIASSYDKFYREKTPQYTQSVLRLDSFTRLKDSINRVVAALHVCSQRYNQQVRGILETARRNCQSFYYPSYVDLCSLYEEMYRCLQDRSVIEASHQVDGEDVHFARQETLTTKIHGEFVASKEAQILRKELEDAMKMVKHEVVHCNVTGRRISRAAGVSIYFPEGEIDRSYALTKFAQQSYWLDLLTYYKDRSRPLLALS